MQSARVGVAVYPMKAKGIAKNKVVILHLDAEYMAECFIKEMEKNGNGKIYLRDTLTDSNIGIYTNQVVSADLNEERLELARTIQKSIRRLKRSAGNKVVNDKIGILLHSILGLVKVDVDYIDAVAKHFKRFVEARYLKPGLFNKEKKCTKTEELVEKAKNFIRKAQLKNDNKRLNI